MATDSEENSATQFKGGCAITTVIVVFGLLALGVTIVRSHRRSLEAHDQMLAKWRNVAIAKLREGPDNQVFVHDGKQVAAMADDAICVENARGLVFSMVDLSDGGIERVNELKNVRSIVVYSCQNADVLFSRIPHMPSIEKIGIETSRFTEAGLKQLQSLPKLKELHIEQVVPDALIDSLKEWLPNVDLKIPYPESAEPRF